jgi:hypothetical protein
VSCAADTEPCDKTPIWTVRVKWHKRLWIETQVEDVLVCQGHLAGLKERGVLLKVDQYHEPA